MHRAREWASKEEERTDGQGSATVKPSAKDRRSGRAAAVNRPSAPRTEFTTTSKSEAETFWEEWVETGPAEERKGSPC